MSDAVKGEVEYIISQFADDTCLYLQFSKECIQEVINELMYIESNTGLKISYEKMTIYRIGLLKNSNAKIYTTKEVNWLDGDIETLGITVNNSSVQENTDFDNAISKMGSIVNLWFNRDLTLMGKILLINTLMASLFIYKMAVLPIFTSKQLKHIDVLVDQFIWKKCHVKIPRKVLELHKLKGGLKLTNFVMRQRAMQLQWVAKTELEEFGYVVSCLCPSLKNKIWECNLHSSNVKEITHCKQNCFWKDILIEWAKIHFHEPQNGKEVRL